MRAAARAKVRDVIAGERDPLTILLAIAADEKHEVQVRVQAAAYAVPYCYPRLSMAVVADASQQLAQRDPARLLEEISARIARLAGPGPSFAPPTRTIEVIAEREGGK